MRPVLGMLATLTCALCFCSASAQAVPQAPNSLMFSDTTSAILVGRFDTTVPSAIRTSLPGGKIGVSFTGPRIDVFLGDTGHDAINVVIDGGAPKTVILRPSGVPLRYTLAKNLSPGHHVAWLTKRTEAFAREQSPPFRHTGTLTFAGFALPQNEKFLPPPAPRSHLIETIGDSGYTGYAVEQLEDASTRPCDFRVTTQNADLSVPSLLGQRLDSEVINSSASGVGMYDSPWDPNHPEHMLPAVYKALVPPYPLPEYGGGLKPVEAVIIDAGANDIVGDGTKSAFINRAGYVEAYLGVLRRARRQHPQAMLFCLVGAGPTGHDRKILREAVGDVVSRYQKTDDKRIVFADYFEDDPNGWESIHDAEHALELGHTCQRHRSPGGAAFLADRLATVLLQHLGWKN